MATHFQRPLNRSNAWQENKQKEAFVDKGYRGHDCTGDAQARITGQRAEGKAAKALCKCSKRRSAVEPKIGQMKSANRIERNFLKGIQADRINAMLAGIGANLRKLLAVFSPALFNWAKIYVFNCRIKRQPKFRQVKLAA